MGEMPKRESHIRVLGDRDLDCLRGIKGGLMEQKIKFVLVGLAGLLVVFVFLFMQTLGQKQALTKERDELQKDNASLKTKITKLNTTISNNERELDSFRKEMTTLAAAKKDVDRKYEEAQKKTVELNDQIKSLKAEVGSASKQRQEVIPQSGNDAYWAGILKAKNELDLQLSNMTVELKNIKILNEQLQREKSSVELELNDIKRQKDDLKREFDYNKKLMDSIANDLVRERNDKMKIQESFKAIKNENKVLIRQVGSLNNRKIALETRIQGLQQDKDAIQAKMGDMETMLTDKIAQIGQFKEQLSDIQRSSVTADPAGSSSGMPASMVSSEIQDSSVALPPIVVRPQESLPSAGSGTGVLSGGKVLAVNKENNFVVIDLGGNQGVKTGDTFQVYRDGGTIATVEAIQVRKDIAACDIRKQTDAPRIGDMVQ